MITITILTFTNVNALIRVPVNQRASLQSYNSDYKDLHAFFDVSYLQQGQMVQADSDNTYYFSKISQKSQSTYQFVKIPHSTGVPNAIYHNIQIYGYEIYGLCTQDGLLDYVVGLNLNSNQLQVMRIYNDASTNTQYIKDYKKVDKDDLSTILKGTVYVDCQYQGKFKDVNTYTIGIAGTYFHPNSISSYYLAKFSTKYNFTEFFVISENPSIMEAARGVKIDLDNKMVYLAVEVNKQIYFNRTVYSPGSQPGQDNANVAIHGYSWTHGVRKWTTLVGNENYTDAFGRMRNYGNYLYVFLNSFSGQYSTNTSQTDIYYYRMRATNGFIEGKQIFGSPTDDKILELDMTFTGIYILAQIGDQFLPHKSNDKMWGTQNQASNLVVIQMSYNDYIIDVEGFDFTQTVTPYPMKLFVPRTAGTTQIFVFAAPRTNDLIDINGGFMTTYLNDSTLFFSANAGCGTTCSKCSPTDLSVCIQCKSGYFLYENLCYLDDCPQFSYQVYSEDTTSLKYCRKCHYSCMTCSGPNPDQCTSCCTNNLCGPIYNRVPSLGKCNCPVGLVDSNGFCVQRCTLNLAGKSNEHCYPQCPGNSFPSIQYDNPLLAQERSQYDSSSQTDCSQSAYHLRFSATGKGLSLQGQPDITQIPKEFTIGFWLRPITLNANSFFLNAYNRIQVKAVGATSRVQFIYKTGTSTTIEPVYTNDAKQKLTLNSWNYLVISQREFLSSNIMKYEQQIALANSNMGTIQSCGYDNSKVVIQYPAFSNSIYIGGFSDSSPQSFTGFIKEFKFFTKYHGIAQIQDEQLRMYRYYSYDDPNLVAYWKFTENYASTDNFYVIKDYSQYQSQISYFRQTNPDYPYYVYDQSISLSLCIFHDVAICKTPKYQQTHPYVVDGKRLTSLPTFSLPDSPTLTKANNDQVWFVPDNKPCLFSNALAYMTYQTGTVNDWTVPDSTMSPVNLVEGNHYQVCYYIAQLGIAFNIYQQYLINKPKTVDPSNSDAYIADGVLRTWNSYEGDQSYGDVIRFALDCTNPYYTDYEMIRNNKPSYGQQTIKNFAQAGDFNLCWQHTYMQELADAYYESIHGMRFRIVSVPTIAANAVTSVNMNEDLVRFGLKGAFTEGDKIAFSWKGLVLTDCNPSNFIGSQYTRNNYHWPTMWFGYSSGIYGIQNYTMDELHMCYMSAAKDAPQAWSRVKKASGLSYMVQVREYPLTTLNGRCPEPISFTPSYGSTELYEVDNTIKFQFKSQAVYPSLQSNGQPGKIAIYRGAITVDGKMVKTSEILWSNFNLNDTITPNPFQQGDLICSGAGQCSIILSQQLNKMKGGEIYYLSFFKESFAYKTSSSSLTRYYLFNDKTLDTAGGQTTAYDHLFFCRSFNIYNSSQMINGKTFTVTGVDMKTKSIRSKSTAGTIGTSIFTTKAINLALTVINTLDTYCVSNPPVATVQLQDLQQTSFVVKNLELRQCNEGTLIADIEIIRGIQDQYGQFTHLRSEQQKKVQLGVIGCDASCLFCNGTTNKDCLVCKDSSQNLLQGQCYSTCPSSNPYELFNTLIWQRQQYDTHQCVSECPLGYYPDLQTKECMECNQDCQTCASNFIGSCLTCEPIKYLFNGICLDQCPSPHHQNNFTSYTCDEISKTQYLKVKIQSLGYKTKIPKDVQQYLKAAISNVDGGEILSILWEQIEPEAVSDEVTIFTSTEGGDLLNRNAIVKLKMTAFNYMSSDQVVKVKCTVQNSLGEIAYDVYEFYQNQPPVPGTSTITVKNKIGTGTGYAVDSIYQMALSAWDDTIAHGEIALRFKLYMIVNGIYYTLTDNTYDTSFYYRLPLLGSDSKDTTAKTVQICVQCTDHHEAISTQCQKLTNVQVNNNYISDFNQLTNHLLPLTFVNNMTNVVYVANMLYQTMQAPKRTSSAPGLCTLDYQCNYNGLCTSQYGNQRCVCDLGYSGTFCQYTDSQLFDLQTIANDLVENLFQNISTSYELKPNDIEIIGTALRGVLKDPDLVSDEQFEKVVQIIEAVGAAPIYAHFPVSINVRQIYLDALNTVLQKMFHSYNVRRALPEGQILAQGLSLDEQYLASQSRVLTAVEQEITQRFRNLQQEEFIEDHQPYLIGGIQNKIRRKLQTDSTESDDGSIYMQWARRIDKQLNTFVEKFIPTLNPGNLKFTYQSKSFDLAVYAQYAAAYKEQTMFIREKDLYWQFPETIFDNSQGTASDKHEIALKAIKYSANPLIFESQPGGFVESNVTDLTFYDSSMSRLNITLQNSYIMVKEPYLKTQSYEDELMRCMTWDMNQNHFINDNSCSMSKIYEDIPCYTCDEDSPLNVSISVCRCTHMSRFAVVFQQTVPQRGKGVQIGIYSDFFAMQYWRNSFGLYAVIAGAVTFAVGQIVMVMMDKYLQPKVMEQLKERIRKLELKGFQQKPKQKKLIVKRDFDGKIIFIRNNVDGDDPLKKPDPKKQDKKLLYKEEEKESTPVTQLQKPSLSKKIPKKPVNQKKFNKDEDLLNDAEFIPAKSKGKKGQSYNPNSSKGMLTVKDKEYEEDHISTDRGHEETKGDFNKIDHDLFEQQMLKRYEEEKEVQDFVKLHGTSSSEEDMAEKMRNKEQKRYLKIEKKAREMYWYHWKSLLIHGNHITSIMYITSILSPRHARWTLLFTCIFLNWFWCAVIYNNTKDPLALPDFDRSARNIAGDDLWISIVAPFGTIILMYIFAGIFKVSDQRLVSSYTMIYLEQMLVELKKEMRLRFVIAYMITIAIYAAITWYVIKFSSTFGWKVSWTWFYSGFFAILLQFVVYDNLISIIHWITYYCSRTLAIFWMKIRQMKQAKSEG